MRVVLAGPVLTSALRSSLGLALDGAPPGTAQTPITVIAAQLRAAGHAVHIVSTDPTIDEPVTVEEQGFAITFCPYRGEPKYRARTRSLDLFEREIQYLTAEFSRISPDVVHAHWTYEYAEAAVRSGLPHVVTMHDLGWEYLFQFRDLYRFVRLVMKYRTMPRVKCLTVVAPFMANKTRIYGYFGPVQVVPNSVEIPASFTPMEDRDLSAPKIVTVGNDGRIKNVIASVEAFRAIRNKIPNATLHLFGPGLDGSYQPDEPGVVRHGNTPHSTLMRFLAEEATLLVHTSRLETFGVIIAEAKARGLPIVAGRQSGGVSYVCQDGASLMVDVDQPAEIAEAVLKLLEPDVYPGVAARCRQDTLERFSPQAVCSSYVDAYAGAITRARHQR